MFLFAEKQDIKYVELNEKDHTFFDKLMLPGDYGYFKANRKLFIDMFRIQVCFFINFLILYFFKFIFSKVYLFSL